MSLRPTTASHTFYHSKECMNPLCSATMDGDGSQNYTRQIVPLTPEISAAYLCRECFVGLSADYVIQMHRACLHSEKGLVRKRFWQWNRGLADLDPYRHLADSVLFLRGELKNPPFSFATFTVHSRVTEQKKITYRKHLALISFD